MSKSLLRFSRNVGLVSLATWALFIGALLLPIAPAWANAVLVMTELDVGDPADELDRCSILMIGEDGSLSEFVTALQIEASHVVLGREPSCDFDNVGITTSPSGRVYYVDDVDDTVMTLNADGTVTAVFDTDDLDALIGETADIDTGLVFGPDGHLYFADEDCGCIVKATLAPDGAIATNLEIVVSRSSLDTLTGFTETHLEGGIAIAPDGTLYIALDSDENESFGVAVVTPGGTPAFLADRDDFYALKDWEGGLDLDLAIELVGTDLYVLEDSDDAVVKINTITGILTLLVDDGDIETALGVTGIDTDSNDYSAISIEGGFAYNPKTDTFFIAAERAFGSFTTDNDGQQAPVIVEMTRDGQLSEAVGPQAILDFYGERYSELYDIDFEGDVAILSIASPLAVDATTAWSLWLMMLAMLGGAGVYFVSRRAV